MLNASKITLIQTLSSIVQFFLFSLLILKVNSEIIAHISYIMYAAIFATSIINFGTNNNWPFYLNTGKTARLLIVLTFQIFLVVISAIVATIALGLSLNGGLFFSLFTFSLLFNITAIHISTSSINKLIVLIIISRCVQAAIVLLAHDVNYTAVYSYFLLGSLLPAILTYFEIIKRTEYKIYNISPRYMLLAIRKQLQLSVSANLVGAVPNTLLFYFVNQITAIQLVEFTYIDRIRRLGQNILKNVSLINIKRNHENKRSAVYKQSTKEMKRIGPLFFGIFLFTTLVFFSFKGVLYEKLKLTPDLNDTTILSLILIGHIVPLSAFLYSNYLIVVLNMNSLQRYNLIVFISGALIATASVSISIAAIHSLLLFELFSLLAILIKLRLRR